MKRPLLLATLALALLMAGCDRPDASADAENLQRKTDELKMERREAAGARDAGLVAELAAARKQLQIALDALAQEQKNKGEEIAAGEEDVEVDGAPRAVVVEENPPLGVALNLTEPLDGEPVAALLGAKDHQVFFAELGRFGDWFETDEFGFVWQPQALKSDPSWRPYTRGRWVNSDQGWTWLSDEPFGWAVYHYGRWVLLADHGWVWVPGDDWAPAWVSWRQSDDYLGWAPLPPETLYDDFYNYDSGIDLAYDIAPDYYNFVPVDYFYEPVLPYCVPRISVVTIVINTVNVTHMTTRDHRVHCGGPDFAWVNRHVRRKVPRCQLDLAGGRDRFASRDRPNLRGDRLEVFAPRVDAPWNAAVCPSRVAGYLGKVEVVRGGKGKIDRAVVHRHQRAAVQRHEAARAAIQTKECQVALRNNLQGRPGSAQGGRRAQQSQGNAQQRTKAEESLRQAVASPAATERRLQEPNLNPKQQAYARLAAANAKKDLQAAREAQAAILPEEGRGGPAGNGGGRVAVERRPRGGSPAGNGPREAGEQRRPRGAAPTRAAAEAGQVEERQRTAAAAEKRRQDEEARVAAQRAQEKDAEQKEARLDEERRRSEVAEQSKRVEAAAKARAVAEAAQRRAKQSDLDVKARKAAEVTARKAEEQRQAAQEAANEERRRQLAAAQKREAAAEEKTRRMEESQRQRTTAERQRRAQEAQAKAEASRRAGEARQKVETDAKRQAIARKQAEEAQRQAVARKQAEDAQRQAIARKQAEDAQRQAAARQRAEDAQRQAVARQRAEDAQRQAMARKQAEDGQRRAAAQASRRGAEERARAESQRRAAEGQRRAEGKARQRAAAEQARRQAESQAKAAAARQQQAAQQRQRGEEARRQSKKAQGRGKR
ncbi:MAG: DUF6600 domain-containing protein [Roseibacillus sp.]